MIRLPFFCYLCNSIMGVNNKRATRSDSLFNNGVVSIKSCSHAETYRIVKTYVLTVQRYDFF